MTKIKNIPLFIKQLIPLSLMLLLVVGMLYSTNLKDHQMLDVQETITREAIDKTGVITE